jgi:hypothetical protein
MKPGELSLKTPIIRGTLLLTYPVILMMNEWNEEAKEADRENELMRLKENELNEPKRN